AKALVEVGLADRRAGGDLIAEQAHLGTKLRLAELGERQLALVDRLGLLVALGLLFLGRLLLWAEFEGELVRLSRGGDGKEEKEGQNKADSHSTHPVGG